MPKAIVIVGPGNKAIGDDSEASVAIDGEVPGLLPSLELLGMPVMDRVVQDLKRGGADAVAIFVDSPVHDGPGRGRMHGANKLVHCNPRELWSRVMNELVEYRDAGTESVLLLRMGPYVEFDVADFLQFHKESGEGVVRAFSPDTAFDLWGLDPTRISEKSHSDSECDLPDLLDAEAARFNVHGYVNRLEHPRDFRALVVDSLNSRCALKPQGFEVRPGVWMAEGAQVEKESRIVAPAYIGRDVLISQQCLITRGSSIERNSLVDYGTVIEDTSVLPNSYVGIGLDVCHSIVDGNKLLNLQREVLLEVEDSAVMRQNKPLSEAGSRWWSGLAKRDLMVSAADESAN